MQRQFPSPPPPRPSGEPKPPALPKGASVDIEALKAEAAALREAAANLIHGAIQLELEVQKICKHLRVIESDTYSNGFGLFVEKKRKCIDCGLKEEAHYGKYKTTLKDADFIKNVSWHEI